MPEFHHAVLPNGLTVLGEVNRNVRSTAVGFFVDTGGRDETPELSGCTHFLEHMMFKGTARRTTFDINREFDEIGGDNNAFTDYEQTVYHAAVLPEFLPRAVDLLADMMRPALRQKDFDDEKPVILNEIAMYLDQPESDLMDRASAVFYGSHPLGRSILGTDASIRALTRDQMAEYFRRRYGATGITVACTGNFDWPAFRDCVASHTSGWERGGTQPRVPPGKGPGGVHVFTRDPEKVSRTHVAMLGTGVSEQDPLRYAAALLSSVIGDRTGSRFYWALVDKGLVEDASMSHRGLDGAGQFEVYLNCDPDTAGKAVGIAREILATVRRTGVTETELKQSKVKFSAAEIIASETPAGRLFPLGSEWLSRREYRPPAEEIAAINAVTTADIRAVLEREPFADLTVVVLGPRETL